MARTDPKRVLPGSTPSEAEFAAQAWYPYLSLCPRHARRTPHVRRWRSDPFVGRDQPPSGATPVVADWSRPGSSRNAISPGRDNSDGNLHHDPAVHRAGDQGHTRHLQPDTCNRAALLKAAAKSMGVKVSGMYWTLGAFDGMILVEAPDEVTAAAVLLQLGSLGSIRTQTVRAFDAAPMQKILGVMPKGVGTVRRVPGSTRCTLPRRSWGC